MQPATPLTTVGLNLSTDGLYTPPNSNPRSATLHNNNPGIGTPTRLLPVMTMLDCTAPLAEPLVPALGPADDVAMARRAERTYRGGPQLIMPYLYLGGAGNVAEEQLQALEITHVLNVAREVSGPPASTAYRHCMWDHNEPDLARYFSECFGFIDSARTRHQGVLVHCQLGVSRSASLIIAYVMRTMAMGFSPAYEYVRLRATCISPNLSLIAQLSEYGEQLALARAGDRVLGPVPELLLLMPDVTLPELTADESSAPGSENSSPMEVQDDGMPADAAEVDLLTMPIKQLPLLALPATTKPPDSTIVASTGSGSAIRQSPNRLHVVAHRHFLVP
ncbi:tyrosine/serine/threonine protein phosphatase [Coemansia pectinata]|nr:tyrosine/serine/threonine protein phosphatase [Coemansia pectinata]